MIGLTDSSVSDLSSKRIFLLYSNHPSFPSSAKIQAGVRSVFDADGVVVDVEYMDSMRLHDGRSRAHFLSMLTYKLSHRSPYDLVITAGDNAFDFVLDYGSFLFPDAPVVFLGVNDLDKAREQSEAPHITGVVEAPSFEETLRLMRSLQPKRHRLNLIVDGTASGQADLRSVWTSANQIYKGDVATISLRTLNWSEYEARLQQLGEEDVVLLLSAYRDSADETRSFEKSVELLRAHANAPIYHLWEYGLGDGLFGGVVVSLQEQARLAASIARRVLKGEAVADIAVVEQSPNVPMFDFRRLQQFNIDRSQLPENAVVLFEPDSVWRVYRKELILAAFVLFGLLAVSFHLAHKNLQLRRLSRELYQKSGFMRRLMDTLPDLVWMKDPDGVYVSCNQRFEQCFGATEADIVGRTDFHYLQDDLATLLRDNDQRAVDAKRPWHSEHRVKFASDGHEELLETINAAVLGDSGEILGVIGVARDITRRRDATEKLKVLSQAVEQSPVFVVITNADGCIEYVNPAFERGTGYTHSEACGEPLPLLQAEQETISFYEELWAALHAGQSWEGEFLNHKKSGEAFWEYVHIAPVLGEGDILRGYLLVSEDISERKRQQEALLYQAQFDALTGLPNRFLSLDRLQQVLFLAKRAGTGAAILYVDLDDFKKVNDSLGHEAGDELLIQVAQRLRNEVRETDTVGRLGGDEFLVLLGGITHADDAGNVANQLIKALDKPFHVGGHELTVTASVGVSLYPEDGKTPEDLLRHSDRAMYSAKSGGKASYAYFTSELNQDVKRHLQLEEQLAGALDRDELYLVYQPQFDLESERLVGIEVLLRWRNGLLGTVDPEEFIPVAEQSGMIVDIGRYVLQQALKELRPWCGDSRSPVTVAINVSPRQFREESFVEFVLNTLEKEGLPSGHLELEVTEALYLNEQPGVEDALERLHDSGVRLAIDDFGTGYSSLSCVRRYPFDTLKIDGSFVSGMSKHDKDYELVFTVIAMAHAMGLTVVAEGVETKEQHELLKYLYCNRAQGFYYNVPVTADALPDLTEGKKLARVQ